MFSLLFPGLRFPCGVSNAGVRPVVRRARSDL